ncbi:MAG: carbonic anhydrase family protein [Candidatus Schekmanbacteria bacterium]|nr:carbonic anhydrase family protein [Candidatus Schekmanbacteria bacterium]
MSKKSRSLAVLIFALTLALSIGCGHSEGEHEKHWGYADETGPAHWGEMKPEFAACKTGTAQSPVDLTNAPASDLQALEFRYAPTPVEIANNGHTIQVNVKPGSFLVVGDQKYELVQFHFHSPSEHTIGGKSFEMAAHLVHKNAEGKLAVVGVLMSAGAENAFLAPIWERLPKAGETINEGEHAFDLSTFLPAHHARFEYMGSLTTPPCTEGVRWLVLKEPVQVSPEQLEAFRLMYNGNARPTQPLHERQVAAS